MSSGTSSTASDSPEATLTLHLPKFGGECDGRADSRFSLYLLLKSRHPLVNAAVTTRAFFPRLAASGSGGEPAATSAQTLSHSPITPDAAQNFQ